MNGLHRQIAGELEPGEQVLWLARPSIRHYVQRRLVLLFAMIGAAVAVVAGTGHGLATLLAYGERTGLVLGAAAAATALAWLAPLRLRLKTVYAITDRRLIRTGAQTMLTNRPGQTFSYGPHEVRFVEISNFGVSRHVYIDRARWGGTRTNDRKVLIGFEDVSDPAALRDRILSWLDTWQQGLLRDVADVRIVSSADHGFRLAVPVSWALEVGVADTDRSAGAPSAWVLRPWDGRDTGWNRLRATGPAGATLGLEVVNSAVRGGGDLRPAVQATLQHAFHVSHESAQTEFAGRTAALTKWASDDQAMHVIEVPHGDVQFRIYLSAPAPLQRLIAALQAVASSIDFVESRADVVIGGHGDRSAG